MTHLLTHKPNPTIAGTPHNSICPENPTTAKRLFPPTLIKRRRALGGWQQASVYLTNVPRRRVDEVTYRYTQNVAICCCEILRISVGYFVHSASGYVG